MTRQAPGFLDAIEDLQRGLSRVRARSMVIGGVAVIAYGVPRTTLDVDATVDAASLELEQLVKELAAEGLDPRINDAIAFARKSRHPG